MAERAVPGVDTTHDELLPFVGPAATLPLWSLLARLPFAGARLLWEALLAGAVVTLVLASLALAGRRLSPLATTAAFALTAASGPVVSAYTLGQAALLGAAGAAAAFLALERRSAWAIAAALVAAAQPNLALPLAVRGLDRRALAALLAAAAAFLALTLAAGGGSAGLVRYLRLLRQHGAAERDLAIQHTLPAIVTSFGVPDARAGALGMAVSLLAIVAIGVAAVRRRREPLPAACIAIALLPLAVPFFHEHDFALDIVPALVLLVCGDARARTLAGVASVMVLVDWFGLAQRPTGAAQTACLALAVAACAALLARRDGEGLRSARLTILAPFGAALALGAVALPLAHAFPAPTWPAMLGPYHAAPGADIATIWGEENRSAGLAAPVAAWGLLRAIPLAGCLVFAYASTLLGARRQAMTTAPSRTASAMLASESPRHGPSVQ